MKTLAIIMILTAVALPVLALLALGTWWAVLGASITAAGLLGGGMWLLGYALEKDWPWP